MSNLQPLVETGETLTSVAALDLAEDTYGEGFRALLTPDRALGPQGFGMLVAALLALCAGTGTVFVMTGAWPVLAFLAVDVVLLVLVLQLNERISRMRETVQLTGDALRVERTYPSGKRDEWSFHPYWVRLAVDENEERGPVILRLSSHGRDLVIGHFMSDEDKHDFADALAGALRDYRSGGAPA